MRGCRRSSLAELGASPRRCTTCAASTWTGAPAPPRLAGAPLRRLHFAGFDPGGPERPHVEPHCAACGEILRSADVDVEPGPGSRPRALRDESGITAAEGEFLDELYGSGALPGG